MDTLKDILVLILIVALVFGALVGCAVLLAYAECNGKTANIGMPARFDLWGGCLIQTKDNVWVPLKNYTFAEVKK